jgi:hypothetical protein
MIKLNCHKMRHHDLYKLTLEGFPGQILANLKLAESYYLSSIQANDYKTTSVICTTPLVPPLSTSMTFPAENSLAIVMKDLPGNLVTVSSSPAPVTTGLGPAFRAAERMNPSVMWRKRVASRTAGSERRAWEGGKYVLGEYAIKN